MSRTATIFRRGAVLVAAVMSLTLVTTDAQAHTHTYPVTSLTLHYHPQVHGFYGKLSTHANCRGNRIIKVFRIDPGPDTVAGSAQTAANGTWSFPNDHQLTGHFYARTHLVHRNGAQHHHTCLGKTSQTINVSQV